MATTSKQKERKHREMTYLTVQNSTFISIQRANVIIIFPNTSILRQYINNNSAKLSLRRNTRKLLMVKIFWCIAYGFLSGLQVLKLSLAGVFNLCTVGLLVTQHGVFAVARRGNRMVGMISHNFPVLKLSMEN